MLFAVVSILFENPFESHEFSMSDERNDLDFQVLAVKEGILIVEVGDRHSNLVHPHVSEENRVLRNV